MIELSPNAVRVLEARYLQRDAERRVVETPEELFGRVARGVADAELLLGSARQTRTREERFHKVLTALDFLPNSPTLMNAGTPVGQLSACRPSSPTLRTSSFTPDGPAGRRRARAVFDCLVDAAWRSGDPGGLYLDANQTRQSHTRAGPHRDHQPLRRVPLLP